MKIHFISIGGSVMHQLAIALKRKGYQITGSDDEIFEPAKTALEEEGILPKEVGWDEKNIQPGLDAVILGMHAKADNPELLKAKELNLPIYSFPEYIFKESKNKTRVVVGGSHGKTTTTAMIMHVLRQAGKDFDYLVGARLQGFDQSVNITDAPVIVCEGDEYPASAIEKRPKFHFLYPNIAVLTGIAWDHINVFPTFDFYLEQFVIFINKIETGGHLIYNETDATLKELVEKNRREDIHYHPYSVPQHSIKNGVTTVTIEGVETSLKVFGAHNLLNLHAAWLVTKQLGLEAQTFANAISTFAGAAKRLELMAKNDSTVFYRDFAHAPSKVKATIEAAKAQFPEKKLIGILELHTFSSLNEAFMNEYEGALDAADEAAVFYSKHALELKRMPELKKEAVKQGFAKENLNVINERKDLEDWLNKRDFENAVVLFMSSGAYDGFDAAAFSEKITTAAE
ncbi:UDP-N-acetylmuramate--L-alanine ligase [Flavisolibacter ginsenosidimutans]|uniref:Peptidoglycan synthetase n=1 Tax=Flavisolibacter ginsenosidimutans TaxID=661481 RepID=A0A5B8UG74_9BACT|nr:Mur ligase family protein [Flavisolibacter ginsenosidimutans]QEC55355.1 peptidoglycan synthetase [Flavisolibacter ginsenosidimutans]